MASTQRPNPVNRRRRDAVATAAALAWLACLIGGERLEARQLPEPQNEGTDTTGTITDRDNTRVGGTAYDSSGKPLPEVEIWVANDASPSQRMRTRTRKTGSYLARGLGPLYTERDVYGVVLRVSFQLPGYQPVEAKVAVEKNELGTVHPILYREGESPPEGRLEVSLGGTITGADGKPVRGATVRVRSDAAPELAAEAVTAKDGRYDLLLWGAPPKVDLEVTATGAQPLRREVVFDPPQRRDVVELATLDLVLGAP
jgi:hypothetical protein